VAIEHAIAGRQLRLGAMVASGASVAWLQQNILKGEQSVEQLSKDAQSVAPGSEGLIFLPYMMGERSPIWHTNARGVFFGLSLTTTPAMMFRAVLEGTAFALAHRQLTSPKYVDQVRMDENGNEYYVRVQIPASKLPSNILQPIYGEEGVTTQPADMTQPQITTQPGQVAPTTQPVSQSTQAPIIKKVAQSKQDIFKQEQDARKDYIATPEVKAFNEMKTSFGQINAGLNAKSAAGDLTAATKFMKLLDPGSVVRESELYLAMDATGVLDKATNYYARLARGEKLTPSQREDFRNIANQLFKAAENTKLNYDKQYEEIARTNNLDPSKIIVNYKKTQPSGQPRNKADILKSYGVE
jgi:hypothetical protein